MAAVTANQLKQRADGNRIKVPVEEATNIYENTLVYVNAAGYAVGDDLLGVNRFLGVAVKQADNTSGADGAIYVEVETEGAFLLIGTFTQASVGLAVYGIDNYTVQHGNTLASFVGKVVEYVSATLAWVKIGDRSTGAGSLNVAQAVNNVHNTVPTAAELTTSFGAVATLGRGFIGTVDDNDGDAISYIVWTTDASFYFIIGTKAA